MAILLSSFYFFYFAIVGVYLIFLPKVFSGIGYSAQEIGILLAALPLVRFILPFFFIRGLELNRGIFNAALVIMVVSAASFYINVADFYRLLASNIALGVGMSLINPYIEVISLEVIGKERYGKVRLFGSVGFILVALVLVKVLTSAQVALAFLLVLSLLTALVAFVIARDVSQTKRSKSEYGSNDINLFKDYKLWLALILMQLSFGSFYNFFTIYETDHGISLDTTIYLWSFGVLVEIAMLFFQGRLLKKNLLFLLQITTLITVLRWFLVYAFADNLVVLYFSQSLHAFSFALFHSAAIAYLFSFYLHKSLAQQFFSGIAYGLGGLIGAVLAGFIYQHYPEYLFLSSSFIAFLSFVYFVLWGRELGNSQA